MKDIAKVSLGKCKYNSLTGKSVIDPTISRTLYEENTRNK